MIIALVRLAVIAFLLSLTMTVLSAYIRLSDSGLNCDPWPTCFAESFHMDETPGISIEANDPKKGLRMLHRALASLFGIIALLLFILAWWFKQRLDLSVKITLPAVVFATTVVLAVVGMVTPDLFHPIVATINLIGGMLLASALFWFILDIRAPNSTASPGIASLSILMLLFFGTLSGAWVSANYANGSCEGLSDCSNTGAFNVIKAAFDPLRELHVTDGRIVIDETQGWIMFTHQVLALVLLALLAVFNVKRFPEHRLTSAVGLCVIGILLIPAVYLEHGVALVSVHNIATLALLLLTVCQIHRSGVTLPVSRS